MGLKALNMGVDPDLQQHLQNLPSLYTIRCGRIGLHQQSLRAYMVGNSYFIHQHVTGTLPHPNPVGGCCPGIFLA